LVEGNEAIILATYETDTILFENGRDPTGLAIGRTPERQHRFRASQLSPVSDLIIGKLSDAVSHAVHRIAKIVQALRFHKRAVIAEIDDEVYMVIVQA